MSHLRTLVLISLMLLVPAGRLVEINISGRTPDIFYVDLIMVLIFFQSHFMISSLLWFWRTRWWSVFIFIGIVIIGGFLSPNILFYLGSLRSLLWALLMVSFTAQLRNARGARVILFALVIGVAVVAVEVFLELGLQSLTLIDDKQDVELDWGRSNYLATFGVVALFVSQGLFRSTADRRQKTIAVICLIASVYLLLVAKSRAAMLAAMFTMFVYAPLITRLANAPNSRRRRVASLWVLALLPACGVLYLSYTTYLSFSGYDLDTFVDSGNLRRFDAWEGALHAFLDSPLWGIGWSNTTLLADRLTITGTTTHSLPMQLLAETGLVGSAAFSLIIWRAFRGAGVTATFSLPRQLRDGLQWAVIAALLHCTVEPSFWGTQFTVVFWTVLSLLLISNNVPQTISNSARLGAASRCTLTFTG